MSGAVGIGPRKKDAPPGCLESKRIPLEEMGKGFSEPEGPKSVE